jgi:hypothetical protein
VLMLLAPFLGRWTYTRANEQVRAALNAVRS